MNCDITDAWGCTCSGNGLVNGLNQSVYSITENNVPYEISALDEVLFTVVKKVGIVHIKKLLLK